MSSCPTMARGTCYVVGDDGMTTVFGIGSATTGSDSGCSRA